MIENSLFTDLIFYIVSAMIISLAIIVIFINDIFRAAIALAGTFLGIAVIYFMLNAEFIGAVQILVYVGAISVLMAFAGRYIFSLPFLLMVLPLIKTKAGLTLLQIVRIWGLLRFLKNSGRFSFNNTGTNLNTQTISLDEAYRILNLDPKRKYNREEVMKSYKKIMKKIHPDVSPELTRLASIVNEAKEIVLKETL